MSDSEEGAANINQEMFPDSPRPAKQKTEHTCRDCTHRQRWQCNTKVFQYCDARKSNRTDNGLLKIKAKDDACILYEKERELD